MRKNYVFGRELSAQTLHSLQQRLIVRDKNLNVITELGQFRRRADKIRNGTRRPVPNENLKPFAAQIRSHSATDNSETDHSNLLVRWMGHGRPALPSGRNSSSKLRAKPLAGNAEVRGPSSFACCHVERVSLSSGSLLFFMAKDSSTSVGMINGRLLMSRIG